MEDASPLTRRCKDHDSDNDSDEGDDVVGDRKAFVVVVTAAPFSRPLMLQL